MEATQVISDSVLESDEAENEEGDDDHKRGQPLAKLCILKNEHVPEAELPLFLGVNVLGRDPSICTLLLPAPSISKQHATISISVFSRRGCRSKEDIEALVWDLGSMNGTRKGRLKLTPNVRYALTDGDSLMVADIPCQYVSCTVDAVSSQGGMKTPVSRDVGVKVGSPEMAGKKEGDKSTDSKKCENGDTEARASTTQTPVRAGCLSLEETPTQPQGILVPESDLDSDGEREGGRRGQKTLVSDSDSHKSSPACSTFLSPTNKIIPESEDESPITPSSSAKNRSYRPVRFSKEQTEGDVVGQRLEEKKALAIVDDSEEEEGGEREPTLSALPTTSKEIGQHVPPVTRERNVSFMGDDELPGSIFTVEKDVHLVYSLDSDTDVEGEEEPVASAGPVNSDMNPVSQAPNSADLHMNSDTDVDEDEDAFVKVPKTVISSEESTKLSHVNLAIQPEEMTMDSDTDVDDDAAVSDTATKTKAMSVESASTAESAPLMQPQDFHLESDTDVDEEDEAECGTNESRHKIDNISIKLDEMPTGPESATSGPHGPHSDSDTDEEEIPAPILSKSLVGLAVASDSSTPADRGVAILSDSDTDMEDNSPQVTSQAVTTSSASLGTEAARAAESDSDADTDVEGSDRNGSKPTDLRMDNDTDMEDKEVELSGGEVENMDTQAFVSPSSVPFKGAAGPAARPVALLSCSGSQEEEEEEEEEFVVAETQSFILQTQDFQSNPPEDHAMDPTQAFCLETSADESDQSSSRDRSFQLGLSESSQQQHQAQALATENTQAFVERSVNVEETNTYATTPTADRASADADANQQATQAYGEEEEEPDGCPEREGQTDMVLEATQAYITKSESDSEDEMDEDESQDITATAETQPFGCTTSGTPPIAETQPMSALEEEESVTEECEEHRQTFKPQQGMSGEVLSLAQTQPMNACGDEESNDEEEEQTQPLAGSDVLLAETQPMHIGCAATQPMATSGDEDSTPDPRERNVKHLAEGEGTQTLTNSDVSVCKSPAADAGEGGESDEEDSVRIFRGRRAKALPLEETQSLSNSETKPMHTGCTETQPLEACGNEGGDEEEEQTQPLTGADLFVAETQPMHVGHAATQPMAVSGDEDSMPDPRERKVKQLSGGEGTQTLTNSDVSVGQSPAVDAGEGGESDEEDSIRIFRGRRAKALPLEETQSLSGSQAHDAESQPVGDCEGEQSDESDLIPGPRKRKAKQLEEEDSQPLAVGDKESNDDDSIPGPRKRKAKAPQLEEEETQSLSIPEVSAVESQVTQSEAGTSGIGVRDKRGSRTRKRVEEEQTECSLSPKRQTRGKSKALPSARGRRGKSGPDQDESEEEEVEQGRRTRRRTFTRLQEDKEDGEFERNKPCENGKRIKKKLRGLGEERDDADEGDENRKQRAIEEIERCRMEENKKMEKEKEEQLKKKRDIDQKERLACEKVEREEREKLERERNEQEESERLERERREEEHHQEILQMEEKERQERETTEQQENKPKMPTRGRRATNKAATASGSAEQDDDVPARRTRSRSNSSNSISSERSASSINTQPGRGKGRGRGARRTSEPPKTVAVRGSNRRRTVAAETPELDGHGSCSVSSQSRGRGGRQGRTRITEAGPDSVPSVNSQNNQNSAARGRRGRKTEPPSNAAPMQDDDKERPDSQPARATRGQRRATTNISESTAAAEDTQSNQDEGHSSEESRPPKSNVLGRAQNSEDSHSSTNISKVTEKVGAAQTTQAGGKHETKDENPVQAKRRGRASSAQVKKEESPVEDEGKTVSEKVEVEVVEKRSRSRPSVVEKNRKEEPGESGTSASSTTPEPQTPTSRVSRKRQASANSSPVAKTPRAPSSSPAARGRLQAASPAYKVLFTGLTDEPGERVLARLGGSMAKGVADMNCLVTDKVRRTVKFLCAVAKGIPIVTTCWLEKSGKAGSFLLPNAFIVKDPEQEKKFGFCLQTSLTFASSQTLLQGYEIHVTKSVKPEPAQMKDIISCSGATFLPKMPSSHKPKTLVISCEEDWSLCSPAVSSSLPVVTAEFILTGILQQKVDFQTHALPAPVTAAGGRGRGRNKT